MTSAKPIAQTAAGLGTTPYTFMWIDALTQKVREGGRLPGER